MFHIELAGVLIQVDNQYEAVKKQCRAFITEEGEKPAFRVAATEQECRIESVLPAYGEEISLCRKIGVGLLEQDVLMFHAAAIEKDGAGYLFAGKSGIGKTTHIRLWQKAFGDAVRVINGDKPLLRFESGRLMAYGSPWMGKERLGCDAKAPVKALCFLERGNQNQLVPMEADEAMERLFQQVLIPGEMSGMDRLLALVERILTSVPCYLLRCRADEEAARVAWEGMKEAEKC